MMAAVSEGAHDSLNSSRMAWMAEPQHPPDPPELGQCAQYGKGTWWKPEGRGPYPTRYTCLLVVMAMAPAAGRGMGHGLGIAEVSWKTWRWWRLRAPTPSRYPHAPRLRPWKLPFMWMMFCLPVSWRASLMADSTASVPVPAHTKVQ